MGFFDSRRNDQLKRITALASDDLIRVQDVSDTTESTKGTSKSITVSNYLGNALSTLTGDDTSPDLDGYNKNILCAADNTSPITITSFTNATEGMAYTFVGVDSTNYTRFNIAGALLVSEDVALGAGDTISVLVSSGSLVETSRTIYNKNVTIAADATTFDGAIGTVFTTSANAGLTGITDIDNPRVGAVYTLIGGSDTNASTIADSGNFSLSGAFSAQANNIVSLKVYADNNYLELSRSINHV
jgi:hypothetical protein